MKIEVGMYVRLDTGKIGKIVYFKERDNYPYSYDRITIDSERYNRTTRNVIKASNNIIDLIEEDDLIKCQFGEQTLILQVGARYTTSYPENGFVKGVFTPDNEFWSLEVLVEEDILQSIVTKEMFSSMEYRLGGNNE